MSAADEHVGPPGPPGALPPPPPAAYHPRAVLLVAAFGPPIRRSSIVGLVAGIVAGAIAGYGVSGSAPWPVVVAVAALVAPAIGVVVGIALLPTATRRAFEAFSWLGHRDVARVRAATGSRTPTNPTEVVDWLSIHPAGSVPAWIRAELLISIGHVDEARAELAAPMDPAAELDRFQVVAIHAYADIVDTGSLDTTAFAAALDAFGAPSPFALEAAVVEALTLARLRLATGAPDPLEPLVRVRRRLGREATSIVLRDTWLPFAKTLAAFGVTAGIVLLILGVAR